MNRTLSSLVLALTVIITTICTTAQAVDEWPMYHHDLTLSGYSSSSGPDTNQILWVYNTNDSPPSPIWSSPAIVNKSLYIGSQDHYLYDINIVDGKLKWKYLSDGQINSSPAVYQNKVYFLTEAGTVYALNADTNDKIWNKNIGDGPYDYSSPSIYDSNVFIASSTGYVYSLKTSNGATNWSKYIINGNSDGPIAISDGKIFLGTHSVDLTLVALDINTGEPNWQYISPYGGFVNSNGAAVADGDGDGRLELYFAVYDYVYYTGWVVCLDEASGEYKWSTNIGPTNSTPAIHNGKLPGR
jgi:eukaryotic-like serine/threonine-protein kinase